MDPLEVGASADDERRLRPYDRRGYSDDKSAQHPLCRQCGPLTHKRAIFWDAIRLKALCAVCAVKSTAAGPLISFRADQIIRRV